MSPQVVLTVATKVLPLAASMSGWVVGFLTAVWLAGGAVQPGRMVGVTVGVAEVVACRGGVARRRRGRRGVRRGGVRAVGQHVREPDEPDHHHEHSDDGQDGLLVTQRLCPSLGEPLLALLPAPSFPGSVLLPGQRHLLRHPAAYGTSAGPGQWASLGNPSEGRVPDRSRLRDGWPPRLRSVRADDRLPRGRLRDQLLRPRDRSRRGVPRRRSRHRRRGPGRRARDASTGCAPPRSCSPTGTSTTCMR